MEAAAFEPYENTEPITVNVTLADYLLDLQEIQSYRRDEFLDCDPNDTEDMVKHAKKLQQTLRVGAGAALEVGSRGVEDNDILLAAKALLQSCQQDAALVEYIMSQEFKKAKAAPKPDKEKLDRLADGLENALTVVFRLRATEDRLHRIENQGDATLKRRLKHWADVAAFARRRRACVPQGHTYYPCRPYPPVPTPPDELVPDRPEAYDAYRMLPPEDLEYDCEHDEFIIPKGYVSTDGKLDHDSIQFDWEHDTVTSKFIGGEPVTWPFYKVRELTFQPEGWAREYYERMEERIRTEKGI